MTIETIIESNGDVVLGKNVSEVYEIVDNSTDPILEIELTFDGNSVNDTLLDGPTIIQAQGDGATGYTLLLVNGGAYTTWAVDGSGVLSLAGESPIDVLDAEKLFQVDLDEDGAIFIDVDGDVTLSSGDESGEYVITDVSGTDPVNLSITTDGVTPITVNTFANFTIQQVKAEGDGYKVALVGNLGTAFEGALTIWTLDANGERTAIDYLTGDAEAIRLAEIEFNVDGLDAIEGIGATAGETLTVLDVDGDVTLSSGDESGEYVITDVSGTDPVNLSITTDGVTPVTVDTFAAFTIQQVKAEGDGYKVVLVGTAGTPAEGAVTIWTLDANGERTAIDRITGDAEAIRLAEIEFNVDGLDDIEGIGSTGAPESLTVLDVDGDVTLSSGDESGEYVITNSSGAEPVNLSITTDGVTPVTVDTFAAFTIQQVKAEGDGYKVVLVGTAGTPAEGAVTIWTLDANGERTAIDRITGDAEAIRLAEIEFNVDGLDDIEGIGSTGAPETLTVLDVDGDVTLSSGDESGEYVITDSSGAEPVNLSITRDGVTPVTVNTFAAFTIQQVKADGDGYKVVLVGTAGTPAEGAVTIWTLDANGEQTAIDFLTGDAEAIRLAEIEFNVDGLDDIEGIGSTGAPETLTVLDVDGDVTLSSGDESGEYVITDSSGAEPVNLSITTDGVTPVTVDTFAAFTIQQVKAEGDGYKVVLVGTAGTPAEGAVTIWTLDANGERTAIDRITGDAEAIRLAEIEFNVDGLDDIEGIGSTGAPETLTVLDVDGDVTLSSGDESGEYVITDVSGAEPVNLSITTDGVTPVTVDTFANFTIQQVKAEGDGYKVVLVGKAGTPAEGAVTIWTLDANGERTAVDFLTGDAEAIRLAEIEFNVDGLDNVDGIGATLIEDNGAVILTESASGQYFVNGIGVTQDGTIPTEQEVILEGEDAFIFTVVAAEATDGGGYQVLVEVTSQADGTVNDYAIGILNEFGIEQGGASVPLDETAYLEAEALFEYDMEDLWASTEAPETLTVLDVDGDVTLSSGDESGEYVITDVSGAEPVDFSITTDGVTPVTVDTFANFTIQQVKAEGDGYKVALVGKAGTTFEGALTIWTLDANGERTAIDFLTGDAEAIRLAEIEFDVDGLDDVEGIGATLIEDNGAVTLAEAASGQYFVDGIGVTQEDAATPLGQNIEPEGEDAFIFTAVAAEAADGGGYQGLVEVTLQSDGSVVDYEIGILNSSGVLQSTSSVELTEEAYIAAEALFEYDMEDLWTFAV